METLNTATELKYVVERIKKGLSYGDDMRSSANLCFEDALALLKETIAKLEFNKCC